MKTFKQYLEEARGFGVLDGRKNPILVVTYTGGATVQLKVEPRVVVTTDKFEFDDEKDIYFNKQTKTSSHVSAIPLVRMEQKKTYYAVAFHKSQEDAEDYIAGYQTSNLKEKLSVSKTDLKGDIIKVGWSDSSGDVTIPQLKPKLFLKNEEWDTLETYTAELKAGIDKISEPFTEIHKQIMQNLVDNTDDNCFRGIKIKVGDKERNLTKMSQVPYAEKFVQKLNNDFGECVGPIKIINDKEFMPWIEGVSKIYVPKESNYPFMDYSITDIHGVEHKISAKTAAGLGNTVKFQDIVTTIEDTLKNDSSRVIMYKLFMFNVSKYGKEYALLHKIFELGGKKTKTIPNILTTAYLLVKEYGARENKDFIAAYKEAEEKFNDITSKSKLEKIPLESETFKTVRSLMSAADKLIRKYSKAPYKINKALKLLINLAFKDKVYFAKFAVKSNGDTVWDVRGRKNDYSNLYKSGSTQYTTMYLDAKGARGNEKVGLRIESTGEFYDLETLFG